MRTAARKALGAAVPAILSSLAALASKPGGERQLADAVAKQSPSALENLANTVGGSGQSAIAGENLLSSLLGGSSFGSLANIIGKFTGLGEGAMRSILGMLTPVILGVLGREAGAGASGLKQLLTSQKDNFAAAMPAGLSNLLQTGGLQDGMGAAASAASRATRNLSQRSRGRRQSGRRREPDRVRIVVELGLLGLANSRTRWAGLVFLGRRRHASAGGGGAASDKGRPSQRRQARSSAPICSRRSLRPSPRSTAPFAA